MSQWIYLVRHGETTWSRSGMHTGTTDIPLTESGREAARRLRPVLAKEQFALVMMSPFRRARETCELAGFGTRAVVAPALSEWRYGEYEGLTNAQIRERRPGWNVFRDGCPGGETPHEIGERVDRVIARLRDTPGDAALFGHGHFFRVLAARWLGLPVLAARHFLLDAGTLNVLGYYRDLPAVKIWNAPVARFEGVRHDDEVQP
jgi:probable phosphoglycerate mutase